MLLGMASDLNQLVLRTDVAGMPLEWIDYREAIRLYHSKQVAYSSGSRLYTAHLVVMQLQLVFAVRLKLIP